MIEKDSKKIITVDDYLNLDKTTRIIWNRTYNVNRENIEELLSYTSLIFSSSHRRIEAKIGNAFYDVECSADIGTRFEKQLSDGSQVKIYGPSYEPFHFGWAGIKNEERFGAWFAWNDDKHVRKILRAKDEASKKLEEVIIRVAVSMATQGEPYYRWIPGAHPLNHKIVKAITIATESAIFQ